MLKRFVLENCFKSLFVTRARFNHYMQLHVSTSTVRIIIFKAEYASIHYCKKLFLRKKNMNTRIVLVNILDSWSLYQSANFQPTFTVACNLGTTYKRPRLNIQIYVSSRFCLARIFNAWTHVFG